VFFLYKNILLVFKNHFAIISLIQFKKTTYCMVTTTLKDPTEKQQAKFNRHKAIRIMEKLTKNMFSLFRNEKTTLEEISNRFFKLKEQLDNLGEVFLDEKYYREMSKYIESLNNTLKGNFELDKVRAINMTKLNRIQKIKNETGYKKKKHQEKYMQ